MAEALIKTKIRIRLLGRFEVAVNGGAVADSGWTADTRQSWPQGCWAILYG